MKMFIVLSLVGMSVAAPAQQRVNYSTDNVQILRLENENPGLANFRFVYEQSDGNKQEQQGGIRNEGREGETVVIKGSYSWVGPDGVTYNVNYTADDDGFRPVLEQGPGGAIPPAIISAFFG